MDRDHVVLIGDFKFRGDVLKAWDRGDYFTVDDPGKSLGLWVGQQVNKETFHEVSARIDVEVDGVLFVSIFQQARKPVDRMAGARRSGRGFSRVIKGGTGQ